MNKYLIFPSIIVLKSFHNTWCIFDPSVSVNQPQDGSQEALHLGSGSPGALLQPRRFLPADGTPADGAVRGGPAHLDDQDLHPVPGDRQPSGRPSSRWDPSLAFRRVPTTPTVLTPVTWMFWVLFCFFQDHFMVWRAYNVRNPVRSLSSGLSEDQIYTHKLCI